jgi:hypothetical protein
MGIRSMIGDATEDAAVRISDMHAPSMIDRMFLINFYSLYFMRLHFYAEREHVHGGEHSE